MSRNAGTLSRRLSSVAGALALTLSSALPGAAQGLGSCQFILGFAMLRDLVGAETVGDCLENQQYRPESGDFTQAAAGGLMIWRSADNWTAFTDGYQTWINGPFGLEQRLNSERFPWEPPMEASAPSVAASAAPVAPAPAMPVPAPIAEAPVAAAPAGIEPAPAQPAAPAPAPAPPAAQPTMVPAPLPATQVA
ncbi:MAG TPA: hypothetical protein VHN78_11255, partial [Chloroflexota bacterium]|nr:hypothetical protein [Chloroflexota bacterium]